MLNNTKGSKISHAALIKLSMKMMEWKGVSHQPTLKEVVAWCKENGVDSVSKWSVYRAAQVVGLQISQKRTRVASAVRRDRSRALAWCIEALYIHLGEPVPPIVKALSSASAIEGMTFKDAFPGGKLPDGLVDRGEVQAETRGEKKS